ncbi:MAG: efflux RND transporter periplasmic adaptor subunit [Puniceicoccaceae bacterium]
MILKILRKSLPFLILGVGIIIFYALVATKPVAQRRTPPEPVIEVETQVLQPQSFTVVLDTQGTVSARTESTLIPQVSGEIMHVADNFREGGFFAQGDILLEIDPSDYQTALTIAEANLAEARVRLAEEEAQTNQAQRDWERLGEGAPPTDLVLRVPQLALARANVDAAEARVAEARRDLERTRITAPYDGRVLDKNVDIGQVVSPGSVLARVYAVDYAEIRLPLTTGEFAFLDVDPVVRGGRSDQANLPVTLRASFGQEEHSWEGRIVRVEGAIDTSSRQVFVVAQVDDPYGPGQGQPLKVGLFVEASIEGSILENVYVLPRQAFREARYILALDEEYRIKRVPVEPLWSDNEVIVFREESIQPGTLACLTQLPLAIDGMHVQPEGAGND